MPGSCEKMTAARRMMNTSSATASSTPGRCTLTATSWPPSSGRSLPLYTWPREADASGSALIQSNTASTGPPRPSSSTTRACTVEKVGTLSCSEANSSR